MPYQRPRTHAGKRRSRAIIQRLLTEDDGMGGQVPTTTQGWTTFLEMWVVPVPLDERAIEHMAGAQITARHGYHFDARYRPEVESGMRMLWRGKTLQIHTVSDDTGRKQRMILYCAEMQ